MWTRWILCFLFFSQLGYGLSVMGEEKLLRAVTQSRQDGVGSGYCGRGVFSILGYLGYRGLRSANGEDWEEVLQQAGWRPLFCPTPEKAPLGSVLVYLSDLELKGYNSRGTKGGLFGHVEMVGLGKGGRRLYVSDAPRASPGGTVPCNFTRRAWIPPEAVGLVGGYSWGWAWYDAVSLREGSALLLAERLELARHFFQSVSP